MSRARDLCRCSHTRDMHEHYRVGNDCSLCECARFLVTGGWLARLFPRLRATAPVTAVYDDETRLIDAQALADDTGCGCLACSVQIPGIAELDDGPARPEFYVGRHRLDTAATGVMTAIRPATPAGHAHLN